MIALVPFSLRNPSDTFASRAVKNITALMKRDVCSFFKAGRAEVVIYLRAREACFEAVDKASKGGLVPLIPVISVQRGLKLCKLLLCFSQLIKQLHLLHLALQQLLLKPSKHAIQLKNPLLHHAFIAQGDHRLCYSKRSLCAFYSTSNPIQHLPAPTIHGCEQKASTVKGAI